MKKLLFAAAAAVLSAISMAVEAGAPAANAGKKALTPEEKAARWELRMQKTGGIVMKKGSGTVAVINAQTKYAVADIERAIAQFKDKLKVNMEIRTGTWKLGDKLPSDANLALYVVEDTALPMSIVAMEAHWGVVNVALLDNATRFDREMARVTMATLGGGVSQYKVSPMQPVSKPEDLDGLVGTAITVDTGIGMKVNLASVGVSAAKLSTYRKACEEGWAASPTNKYQQAVWNEVHTLPSAPLQLKK